jgi:acetyltransferase-like isoleucine patch superfamily enzyme
MIERNLATGTKPKVSIITVVKNDRLFIERTLKSVIEQDYDNIEYIIIDGNSSDGTQEIVRRFEGKIAVFISEDDNGIYHAMNKGAFLSTGSLLTYLNSGDTYVDGSVISDVVEHWLGVEMPDVVYGHSFIERINGEKSKITASPTVDQMWKGPVFRHGSMFVKTELQVQYPFEIGKEFKISADFNFIFLLYSKKYSFSFLERDIIAFRDGGVSSNYIRCLKDNQRIVKAYTKSPKYVFWYSVQIFKFRCKGVFNAIVRPILRFWYQFIYQYTTNNIIAYIPFYAIRHFHYKKICGIKMGRDASIHMRTYITGNKIIIGKNSVIGRSCYLDGRCDLRIGSNVSVSPHVHIITASHDLDSPNFENVWKPVVIHDYAWIGSRATILPGVCIGEGAVVGVGSIVTKDVDAYDVVAGNPAKRIKTRNKMLNYSTKWMPHFD